MRSRDARTRGRCAAWSAKSPIPSSIPSTWARAAASGVLSSCARCGEKVAALPLPGHGGVGLPAQALVGVGEVADGALEARRHGVEAPCEDPHLVAAALVARPCHVEPRQTLGDVGDPDHRTGDQARACPGAGTRHDEDERRSRREEARERVGDDVQRTRGVGNGEQPARPVGELDGDGHGIGGRAEFPRADGLCVVDS